MSGSRAARPTRRYGRSRCRFCDYEITPGTRCSECGVIDEPLCIRADRPPTKHIPIEVRRLLLLQVAAACAPVCVAVAFRLALQAAPRWGTVGTFQSLVFWTPLLLLPPMLRVRNRWLLPKWPNMLIMCATVLGVFGLYRDAAGIIEVSPSGVVTIADFLYVELMIGSQFAIGTVLAVLLIVSERLRGRGTRTAKFLTAALSIYFVIAAMCLLTYILMYLGLYLWILALPVAISTMLIGTVCVLRQARTVSLVRLYD